MQIDPGCTEFVVVQLFTHSSNYYHTTSIEASGQLT